MLIKILKNAIKDIRLILGSKFFWSLNIIFLIIMTLLFISYLPFNSTYSIKPFIIGPIFVNVLIMGISVICLYLNDGIKKKYDQNIAGLYTISEYIGKTIAFVFIIIVILATLYPLGLLVCSIKSLNLIQFHYLNFLALIAGISFVWVALFLRVFFKEGIRKYASAFIQIVWFLILIISYFSGGSKIYINSSLIFYLLLFSASLFIILLFKGRNEDGMTGVDIDESQ